MKVAEFFAGIGLAGIGLESSGFDVVWSNDMSESKFEMFTQNSTSDRNYLVSDVGLLADSQLPKDISMAWASFPCTDLSSAGLRKGIHQGESSAFWAFLKVVERMGDKKPNIIAIENVPGLALNRGGNDLKEAIRGLNGLGYSVDILEVDARRFVPQSRVRIFLIGSLTTHDLSEEPHELRPAYLEKFFGSDDLVTHRAKLPNPPAVQDVGLTELIQSLDQQDLEWWNDARVEKFEGSLSSINHDRLASLRQSNEITYRTAYRRMRNSVARWEIAAKDIAGCLRTARGGSSRQAVLEISSDNLRVRWMTPREYAALMGVASFDFGDLPRTKVLNGFGDAVCVPVVSWLADVYLSPWSKVENRNQSDLFIESNCNFGVPSLV
ncbi:DNA (cytosine-5-)-methyltransferase [Glutamicibacter uratoxydans]|uniref:DNA (cytosine-5-)-methyltransferase n=1 Tax=Glutamicibacter uratoxydans TaxID=43667 RepID=A0A4Y4DP08_GLUUR|nr:DNA (cytosine-5-)-methyltransferase [Glutamicibacter uratoxydans]GED05088.1 DNA (cytosine-5-)-methyltransferase [Glutamicibacter uratoxydans]